MTDPVCGAIPPNVGNPVPCQMPPGHDGQHFSTTGCRGSEIRWSDQDGSTEAAMANYTCHTTHGGTWIEDAQRERECWCGADGGEGCHCCTEDCPEDCMADHKGEQ